MPRAAQRRHPIARAILLSTLLIPGTALIRPVTRVTAQAAGCAAPLTLRLRTGVPGSNGIEPPMPAPALVPMPPGTVAVHVPLYPGASPTTQREIFPTFDYPATPYIKTAMETFLLPATVDTAVAWYQRRFAACSYTYSGLGSGSDGRGDASSGVRFTSRDNPSLVVQLSFEVDAGHTLVLYVAEDTTQPARPAGSYLPAGLTQVRITYVLPIPQSPSSGPQPEVHRTITGPSALRALVHAVNALAHFNAGLHSCGFDEEQSATLVFQSRTGQQIKVYDEPVCVGVVVGPYPALTDPSQTVWKAISALVYSGGTPTPTPNLPFEQPTPTPVHR